MIRSAGLVAAFSLTLAASAQLPPEFRTDTSKRSVRLAEIIPGGPPKDGIPAISDPKFVSVDVAATWLDPAEPVQVVRHASNARVYPLQILIWHELVNDRIGDLPLLISFCPLCNAAVVFDRRVDGEILEFGVSGLLRHSDMVMFDRRTDSLWQQLTGEAIVGAWTGRRLAILPSQVIPFGTVADNHPGALVLSRDTGHSRPYGRNPYELYEPRGRMIFPVKYKRSRAIKPLERMLAFRSGDKTKGYLVGQLRDSPVRNGGEGQDAFVVFYQPDMRTPLGARRIAESNRVGTVGVFSPFVEGRRLEFAFVGGKFVDRETSSTWNLVGRAVAGPLAATELELIQHGVYFAFAWLAFEPDTEIARLADR